jgi:hypothetical protein
MPYKLPKQPDMEIFCMNMQKINEAQQAARAPAPASPLGIFLKM